MTMLKKKLRFDACAQVEFNDQIETIYLRSRHVSSPSKVAMDYVLNKYGEEDFANTFGDDYATIRWSEDHQVWDICFHDEDDAATFYMCVTGQEY